METINYLRITGKDAHHLKIVSTYTKIQNLWNNEDLKYYDEIMTLNQDDVYFTRADSDRDRLNTLI